MNNNNKGEAVEVQDKSSEVGIKLNNVLTAILISVMLWVGTSILSVKEEIGLLRTDFAVQQVESVHLKEELFEHIRDKTIHTMGHTHAN